MLSRTARQEITRKLEAKTGFPVDEGKLTLETRRAIGNLADFQRHIFVISEILNGEVGRVESSVLLSLSSKVWKDKEIASHSNEITQLQKEIDAKVTELSVQIAGEVEAARTGNPPQGRQGGLEAAMLKCPSCGAALPIPTGRYLKCEYCNSTLSFQEVSAQMREMIRSI
jgi:DNA-directed RNA polymerase subunit RPC12/RpoP